MKQNELIKVFKQKAVECVGTDAAILYGSFARKSPSVNSDMDLAVLINEKFDYKFFENFLWEILGEYGLNHCFNVTPRNKFVLYFEDLPKMEIAYIENISEIKRNYLGSKIPIEFIDDTILFDKTGNIKMILKEWSLSKHGSSTEDVINELITKFIYEFENCSTMHARSDGYQFYYFYNIALHVAVQLRYISEGKMDFYFLPKRLTALTITEKEEQNRFYDTSGSLYLRDANRKKRNLLDFFYSSLEKMQHKRLKETGDFLEKIYKRDFLWNFRDVGKINPKIDKGKIYRTSTLTAFQDEVFLKDFLKEKRISTIIDLRAEREIEQNPYKEGFINNFKYIKASFDPWNQPQWFKETEHYGTNTEIAYRFFVKACKNETRKIFETLAYTDDAVAIHCHAGKDRTGFVIMLINMLLETSYETMLQDYLASEMDANENKFKIYYDNIVKEGGIINYLNSCGLDNKILLTIKNKLKNG
jgi:predicted nucleotidyltransferase